MTRADFNKLHESHKRLWGFLAHWRANYADMVSRNAILSQRPDQPIDRIPAYKEIMRLRQENAELRERMKLIEEVSEKWRNCSDYAREKRDCEAWYAIRTACEDK